MSTICVVISDTTSFSIKKTYVDSKLKYNNMVKRLRNLFGAIAGGHVDKGYIRKKYTIVKVANSGLILCSTEIHDAF